MSDRPGYQANLQRGILLREHGRFQEAAGFISAAIESAPENPRGYYEQAVCFCNWGNGREALRYLDRAQALAPNEPEFLDLRAWILGHYLLFSRKALALADKALAIDPTFISAFITKARIYNVGNHWKKSESTAREALRLDPRNDYAANLLAIALRKQGRFRESGEVIAQILQRVPNDAFGHANAGWTALQMGEHERAHAHFLTALSKDPREQLALAGLREALMQRAWPYRIIFQAKAFLLSQGYGVKIFVISAVFLCPVYLIPVLGTTSLARPFFDNLNLLMTFLLFPIFLMLTQRLALLCILSHPSIIHSITWSERWAAFCGFAVLAGYAGCLLSVGIWLPSVIGLLLFLVLVWSIRRPDKASGNTAIISGPDPT